MKKIQIVLFTFTAAITVSIIYFLCIPPTHISSISGTVIDIETGLPVWGVTVKAVDEEGNINQKREDTTNKNGEFKISLDEGNYALRFESAQYQLYETSEFYEVDDNKTTEINKPFELSPITSVPAEEASSSSVIFEEDESIQRENDKSDIETEEATGVETERLSIKKRVEDINKRIEEYHKIKGYPEYMLSKGGGIESSEATCYLDSSGELVKSIIKEEGYMIEVYHVSPNEVGKTRETVFLEDTAIFIFAKKEDKEYRIYCKNGKVIRYTGPDKENVDYPELISYDQFNREAQELNGGDQIGKILTKAFPGWWVAYETPPEEENFDTDSMGSIDSDALNYQEIYGFYLDDAVQRTEHYDQTDPYTFVEYTLGEITGDAIEDLFVNVHIGKRGGVLYIYSFDGSEVRLLGSSEMEIASSEQIMLYENGIIEEYGYKGDHRVIYHYFDVDLKLCEEEMFSSYNKEWREKDQKDYELSDFFDIQKIRYTFPMTPVSDPSAFLSTAEE